MRNRERKEKEERGNRKEEKRGEERRGEEKGGEGRAGQDFSKRKASLSRAPPPTPAPLYPQNVLCSVFKLLCSIIFKYFVPFPWERFSAGV